MPIYSSVKVLRQEKIAASYLTDVPLKLLQDMLKPIVSQIGQQSRLAMQEARFKNMKGEYQQIFRNTVHRDPLLKDYEDKESLSEAYKVMIKFAPNMALEPLVVKSFLRMYIQSDGVISDQQIRSLVEAEGKYVQS